MKVYPNYKKFSGKWIDEIPVHWYEVILKRITQFLYGDSLSNDNRAEGDTPVFGSNGVVGYHNSPITKAPCIIIGRKGSFGKVIYSEIECFPIDTTFYIDETATNNSLRWIYYLLLSLKLDAYSKDSAVPGLSREDAYSRKAPIPPLLEQQAIADFLDHKTSQIDVLIAQKQRKIELLQEYRTALINQAVTKGLNPDAPMKDTGIEWLGQIPNNWSSTQLKFVTENYDKLRIPLSAEIRGDMQGEYPYYGANGIIDYVNDYIFDGEYLLIGEDGAPFFQRDDVALIAKGKFWVNNHAHILRTKDGYDINYLKYCLNCVNYSVYISGSTRDKLTQSNLSQIRLPFPHLQEQAAIAKFLDRVISQVDKLILKIEMEIDSIEEYSTSLISKAVTGKIDVRE